MPAPSDAGDDEQPDALAATEAAQSSARGGSGVDTRAPARKSIGRFRLDGALGSGGMGDVFRAYDPVLDRAVALKILRSDSGDEGAQRMRRVLREARAAASLSHPNAVTVFEVGEADGEVFIAMELLEGQDLRSLIGQGDATLEDKLRWLLDAARALSAAHARGLVHRDVKPENMFVCADGTLKLLDFGIAKRRDGDDETPTPSSADGAAPSSLRTTEGRRIGTPRYMAPEQQFGHATDARTDQYAWGLVAFELLTGAHPSEATATVTKQEDTGVLLPSGAERAEALLEHAPETVARLIARTLEPVKEERLPDMGPIVAALERAAAGEGSSRHVTGPRALAVDAKPNRSPTPAPSAPAEGARSLPIARPRPKLRAWLALGAVVAVAVTTATLVATRHPTTSVRSTPSGAAPIDSGACTAAATWAVTVTEHDRYAAMTDGSMVIARDLRRGLAFERVLATGPPEPYLPKSHLTGMRDFTNVRLRGVEFDGGPALLTLIDQDGRTPLATASKPDGLSSLRLHHFANAVTAATVGDGVVLVTTSESSHSSRARLEVLQPAVRAHLILRSTPLHALVEEGPSAMPAVATSSDHIAVAYVMNGALHAALLDAKLARVGDVMRVAPVIAQPAVAWIGPAPIVFWAAEQQGKLRLTSARIESGAEKFSAARTAIDEPLGPQAPMSLQLPDGTWVIAWVASSRLGHALRMSRLGPDGALVSPSTVTTRESFVGLQATATRTGVAFTWTEGPDRARVMDVRCKPAH